MTRLHSPAMRNITRFEHNRTRGWWVRILRHPKPVSRFFSDLRHGGRAKALVEARAFRDGELERAPGPRPGGVEAGPGRVFQERKSWSDSSGKKHLYVAWTAWIKMSPGVPASTSYSVRKYGQDGAKRKADEWLFKKVEERKLPG